MIKAIIFDCFGVLVTDALSAIVTEMQTTDPETVEQIVDTVKAANKGIITTETSRTTISALLGLTIDEYVDKIRDGEVRNQELLDYILVLRKSYKVGLLSNIGPQSLEARFNQADQAKYFDAVVASGVVGYAKPEAEAYGIAVDRLGVRFDESVMIDDRQEYIDGATAVGMQGILYASFSDLKTQLVSLDVEVSQAKRLY